MTPAKRRPATPSSQGPTRTAPDVPVVAVPPPNRAATKDDSELLGPDGEPVAPEAPTRPAGKAPTPPRPVDTQDGTKKPAPRRSRAYPLPVWPD